MVSNRFVSIWVIAYLDFKILDKYALPFLFSRRINFILPGVIQTALSSQVHQTWLHQMVFKS